YLNGDSPIPTRVIEGVVQPVAPTTAEQRLARKNELKARAYLLNGELMPSFGGTRQIWKIQSLDDLFNNLKIYKAEVKSSSASTNTQTIAFVSSQNTDSTNEPVSAVDGVSVASVKIPVFALPNVDTLSNAVIYSFLASKSNSSQLDNDDLKQIDDDDLEEMDLKWQMAMLTVECYNCHRKDTLQESAGHLRTQGGMFNYDWSFQAEEEPTNYALMAFTSSSSDNEMFSSKTDESLPASPIYDRYQSGEGYHAIPPPYIGTFMPPKPDLVFHNAPNVNETIHTVFNVELSPTKPDKDLSHTHRPSAPIIEDWVSDSEDDYEAELPQNAPSFVQPTKQVKTLKPYGNPQHALMDEGVIDSGCSRHMTGNMSYLTDFEEINGGYVAFGGNPKGGKISSKGKIRTGTKCIILSPEFKLPDENQVLLRVPRENNMYNVDLKSIVPSGDLTCLFTKVTLDEFNLWHRRLGHINFKTMNKLVKGNLVRGLPSKVFENNYTCVVFKKGKQHRASCKTKPISSVSQPLQRSTTTHSILGWAVNTACYVENRVLVNKPHNKTPYELLLSRKPSICFIRPFGCPVTILNTLDPLGKFDGKADEGFLVGYSNTDSDATFEVKEPEFEGRKPESEVYVSPSSSAKTKKHDDKTKREAKGKIPTVGEISTNSTNTFSVAGPSNTAVSPTLDESSYVDPFQYPDDLNMPALEDITYSDDEEDVGAEADFSNLETTITVSPIPKTRVHKDHPVTQIIGYLSLATQTRSITKMVKDQGGATLIQDAKVWILVALPNEKRAIGTKYVFRNKKDERGIVVKNKARLVAQRHTQEEGINYEEVFALVARIEAISLFLAYASFIGFMVYQMDVKRTFLYGSIEEEVYVYQPPGFEDPDYPDKVYKVVKALYGLHQAPRAWYETLANYLLENGFQRGKIDQTLFTKKQKGDILLVQVYVDDTIFGYTNKDLCKAFEKLMKDKFQMSSMGELTFFLDKKSASTSIDTDKPLLKDPNAYSDSDYAGASLDKKSTTGGCQFLRCRLISWQCKKQTVIATSSTEAEYVPAPSCCAQTSWNEFSSSMASAVICLSTGRKFNFSKYIFNSLVRNVDSSSKFYMYPRFLQLMIRAQEKGFSGVETPLFEGMIVAQQADDVADEVVAGVDVDDVPAADAEATSPSPPPTTPPPPPQELPSTS
nr:putative ribonuclease H-like domain-containing protein [Tanacetum cinerariifolium]